MKSILALLGVLLLVLSGILIYKGYQEYVNPKQIYGNWFEIKVMPDRREVIKFTDQGVYRNSHLVTTKFKYDGKTIRFKAGGEMETIYQLSGTVNSPQLKRIQPDKPVQTLIKEGHEDTLEQPEVLRTPRRIPFGVDDDGRGE